MSDCGLLMHSSLSLLRYSMYCYSKCIPYVANFANILDRPHLQNFGREIFCSHTLYIHNVMQSWQAVQDTHASM